MLKQIVALSIALLTATPAIASDMPIRIPNPPVTRSTNGKTYQQCLIQVSNMWAARNARGANKEQSARLWVRHVAQCKAFAPPRGQKTPRQTTGSATR